MIQKISQHNIRIVTDYNKIHKKYISFVNSELKLNETDSIQETINLMSVDYTLDIKVIKAILDRINAS